MQTRVSIIGFGLVLWFNSFLLWAQSPPKAGIASAHPMATAAGHEILQAGGNAFDAAVAVSATLSVVEPYSSGIGGGAFFLLHREKDQADIMIDAREKAPLAATRDMYLNPKGEFIKALPRHGVLAGGIPGLPAALVHLAEHYGNLPLAKSLIPAIRAARQGFKVTPRYLRMLQYKLPELKQNPEAAAIFLHQGDIPDEGYIIVQKDLAKTLQAIAQKGHNGFYQGALAEKIIDGVKKSGGIWTIEDLKQYQIVQRQPQLGEYRGMKIISAAPPSSGGITMITALNILSAFEQDKLSAIAQTHLLIEAMRRAYRDRAQYLGDPDFIKIPDFLTNKHYALGLAAGIRHDKATPSELLPGVNGLPVGNHTSHFSVIDRQGNRVAATQTINLAFGSGFVIPGTGILMNNEMDDFSGKINTPNAYGLLGNQANEIAPGKRMLSSMTPTFLQTGDRIAIVGTPGGSRIISMVLLAALAFYEGASAEQMVSKPRFHHQFMPDVVSYEVDAFNRDQRLELQLLGHQLKQHSYGYGNMQAVVWDKKQNTVEAASDPRGEGSAVVQ